MESKCYVHEPKQKPKISAAGSAYGKRRGIVGDIVKFWTDGIKIDHCVKKIRVCLWIMKERGGVLLGGKMRGRRRCWAVKRVNA